MSIESVSRLAAPPHWGHVVGPNLRPRQAENGPWGHRPSATSGRVFGADAGYGDQPTFGALHHRGSGNPSNAISRSAQSESGLAFLADPLLLQPGDDPFLGPVPVEAVEELRIDRRYPSPRDASPSQSGPASTVRTMSRSYLTAKSQSL